jgi:hypothetical protein
MKTTTLFIHTQLFCRSFYILSTAVKKVRGKKSENVPFTGGVLVWLFTIYIEKDSCNWLVLLLCVEFQTKKVGTVKD